MLDRAVLLLLCTHRRAEQFEEDSFRAKREMHATGYTLKDFQAHAEYEPTLSFGAEDVDMERDGDHSSDDDNASPPPKAFASLNPLFVPPVAPADAAAGVVPVLQSSDSQEKREAPRSHHAATIRLHNHDASRTGTNIAEAKGILETIGSVIMPRFVQKPSKEVLSVVRKNKPPPPSRIPAHAAHGGPVMTDNVLHRVLAMPGAVPGAADVSPVPFARSPVVSALQQYPVVVPSTPPRQPVSTAPPGIAMMLRQAATHNPSPIPSGDSTGRRDSSVSRRSSDASTDSHGPARDATYSNPLNVLAAAGGGVPPLSLPGGVVRANSVRSSVSSDVIRRRPPPPPIPAPPAPSGADSGAGSV